MLAEDHPAFYSVDHFQWESESQVPCIHILGLIVLSVKRYFLIYLEHGGIIFTFPLLKKINNHIFVDLFPSYESLDAVQGVEEKCNLCIDMHRIFSMGLDTTLQRGIDFWEFLHLW